MCKGVKQLKKNENQHQMTLRKKKKVVLINEKKNCVRTFYINKQECKKFFDLSTIKENLKNRREIMSKRKEENW